MKKMLLIFLILFSKVLASPSSEENKYVDLLPDEEKEIFLEKVARRINEEVDTQEDLSKAENTEIPEDELKRHTDYVKSVIKEEQANFRKNRSNSKGRVKEITSEENGFLEVTPLKTKRMAEADPEDVNPPEMDTSNDTTTNNVTENVSSALGGNNNKGAESEDMISETNKAEEKSNKVRSETGNADNGTVPIYSKDFATDDSKENTKSKDSIEINLEKEKTLSDSDAQNVLVKDINEPTSSRSENTVENSTTSAVSFDIITSENNTNIYKNGSSEEILTTAFQSVSTNETLDNKNLTESISSENNSTETGSSENMSFENNNERDPLADITTLATNEDDGTKPEIKPKNDTADSNEKEIQTTAETPTSSLSADDNTSESTSKVIDVKTTESPTKSTFLTTENASKSVPVLTTLRYNTSEDSTPATTQAPTKSKSAKPKVKKTKKKPKIPRRTTTVRTHFNDEIVEATTKKLKKITKITKRKVKPKIHKVPKVIMGPKAKKNAKIKSVQQKNNVVEFENTYFDNNYKVKHGKEYHVFEIPDGATPFIQEDPAANQPYYVPIYNYSPNNAYFNPLNRLGPNAGDRKIDVNIHDDDNGVSISHDDNTFEVNMKFDRQRKKFSSKHSTSQDVFRFQPRIHKSHDTNGKINRNDNSDADYFFERLKDELATEARRNVDKSLPKGNLKDYVRAIRNILFKQHSFGAFQKDDTGIGRISGINPDNQNNIAVNLFEDENNKNRFKKPGYLKGDNSQKPFYVLNESFKTNIENYLQENTFTPALPQNRATNNEIFNNLEGIINTLNKRHNKKEAKKRKDSNPKKINNKKTANPEAVNNEKFNSRSHDVAKVNAYVQVLNDMVTLDNKALMEYDWLGTTVDIQAALQKLFELTDLLARNEKLHPSDKEILKYCLFLHKLAREIIEANDLSTLLRDQLEPTNKKMKPHWLKEEGLVDRIWLYLRKEVPEVSEDKALKQLNMFLSDVKDGLFDLHEAIKNIAKITKYNNQHWYQNLKELYINLDEKHLLELLLHITALRLFSLIEESSRNGLEEDYITYMKENREHCKKTLDEMIFIINILEKYKKVVQ